MGKRSKRIKIPKNRDIEEFVEKAEEMAQKEMKSNSSNRLSDKKKQDFQHRIQVTSQNEDADKQHCIAERKIQNFNKRRDAEMAEEARKLKYLKVMNKIQEQTDERI